MAENLGLFRLLRRFWGGGLGEIAWPIVEFEVLPAQVRVDEFDAHTTIRTVAILVRRRVRNQIALAQISLNLRERATQILFVMRKESATARIFGDLLQGAFIDSI